MTKLITISTVTSGIALCLSWLIFQQWIDIDSLLINFCYACSETV